MHTPARSRPPIPHPSIAEVSSQELRLETTLVELRLHEFQVESFYTGREAIQILERYPMLPGIVLKEQGQYLGMISRQRLLEFLIRPKGTELFLPRPLSVLYSYAQSNSLILPESTTIVVAAQLALRRPLHQQGEPIVVVSTNQDTTQPVYQLLDAHELNIAYWQIRGIETQVRYERSQMQMIQIEKMANLGRLVDGVAHEILDPVGFIWGNLVHLSTYVEQIMELLTLYEQHFPDVPDALTKLRHEIELDYLRQDIPQTFASIRAGANRLKKLANSLQNFCHIDDVYPKPADLHEGLDSILLLLKSRITGEIEIVKNYGHLPPVTCYAGQLNQVFMNILSNATYALLKQVVRQELANEFNYESYSAPLQTKLKPCITITTYVRTLSSEINAINPSPRWVSICIADNGPGLSLDKQQQILDSFSIEKRADKETSLAMSYQIITAKHGGKFYMRSPACNAGGTGIGTEFEILLPLI
ncbi:MAG: hypothetical protein Kow00121_46030 [Elainellaceae cyanobacterium]